MDQNEAPNILARLEELRLWHEQHQSILLDKNSSIGNKSENQNNIHSDEEDVCSLIDSFDEVKQKSVNDCLQVYLDDTPISSPQKQFNIEKMETLRDNFCIAKANQQVREKEINKKPFLKRGEGLTSRFRINPDSFKLNNLPKYKYANVHKKLNKINIKLDKKEENDKIVECPGKKKITNNKSELNLIKKPKQEMKEKNFSSNAVTDIEALKLFSNWVPHNRPIKPDFSGGMPEESKESPIKWSTVLDTQNVTPIHVGSIKNIDSFHEKNDKEQKEIDDLNIFELLEKHADNTSFNLNSTDVSKLDYPNYIETKPNKIQLNDPLVKDIDVHNFPIKPYPNEKQHKIVIDDSFDTSSDDSSSTDDESDTSDGSKHKQLHVHFSDKIIVNQLKNVDDNYLSSDQETFNAIGNTSTPTTKMLKLNEEENNCITEESESTIISKLITQQILNDKYNELNEKTVLLKNKLIELDKEIEVFRSENNLLIKMKQDHELEKNELENLRRTLYEEINDEKIRLEVELHDERMKILGDKEKYEKLLKEMKNPNRRERDEIIKLKEVINCLEKDLKSKESKHVSAQARLRSQMRLMEKELKEQIEKNNELKKENKKLDTENIRLKRQSSNKMLKEISKNINNLKLKNDNVENNTGTEKNIISKKNGVLRRSQSKTDIDSKHVKNPPSNKDKSDYDFTRSNYFVNTPTSSDLEDANEMFLSKDSDESDADSDNGKLQQFVNKANQKHVKFNDGKKKNVLNRSNNSDELSTSDKWNLKREIINEDGSKDIWYENGNLKKISADGLIIRMLYFNKDIKETNIIDGIVKYYYNDTNTWHTTYLDGLEILEFPNGQKEHRYKNGIVEVNFPNGTILKTNKNDNEILEEWNYPDGTNCIKKQNGEKILKFTNGQIEIHTDMHKRREYPDGTIKYVYPDGSQETRYSNGRIRLKDKNGVLVIDSENTIN